ncbi:NADP-dependent malic enzyme [Bordetella pertussis]|nr:NADP-dependent malic enzyme [Bordetella pertussis]
MDANFRKAALEYHEHGRPGKISVTPTKQLSNQRDLSLAYSPGVAAACEEIVDDPVNVFRYTGRGNLVGVITNGTAVLGLGNIGALASKPVMEGKAVLFKKFAGLDVFDIEINETDPDKLVEIIAGLEATFGGINLEDIKAPECFTVERKLRERMKIPVFHDDQHGTAITVCAAVVNGLAVAGKRIEDVKLVTSGAGAAALACLDLLVDLGLPLEHIWVTDIEGVVYEGRKKLMDADKERFARKTKARTLAEVIEGADVFLGLSAGNVLKPEMVATMAANPLILALANPNPEILPRRRTRCATTSSWPPAVRITRTRSTTCCAFRTSSAARWTWARPRSRARWKRRRSWPSPAWRAKNRTRSWPRPTAPMTFRLAATT